MLMHGQTEVASTLEGDSVNISCSSTGGPLPSITWTLNNQSTNFSQTDIITEAMDTMIPRNVMSTLHIVNAQYPTHDGVYTCTGRNSMEVSTINSSINITVVVQGE